MTATTFIHTSDFQLGMTRWFLKREAQARFNEDREAAIVRLGELAEETGVTERNASIIGQTDNPIRYDLPDELQGKLWGGRYRGQRQTWFLARFTGEDDDIRLDAHQPAEFDAWQWIDPEQLPEMIVPFKKRVYRAVLEEFRELV